MLLSPQDPPRDLSHLRALVPVASHRDASGQAHTYLNASFQPPMNLIVRSAIHSFLDEATFSPHPKPTWQSRAEDLRALLATYLHAPSASTIALTRDTTEGLNLFQRSLALQPGDNVLILDSEHPNQACGWLALRESAGIEVRQVPTAGTAHEFHATAATFAPYVDARTRAVGLSSCMFHSGQRNDVAGIAAAMRARGIHVLADLTQEVGFGRVDVQELGVSAAAFGLHKGLGCPTGLGALYVDPGVLGELKGTPPIVGAGAVANLKADLTVSAEEGGLVYHGSARRFEHLNVSLVAVHAARAALRFLLYDVGVEAVEAHLRALGRRLREGAGRLGVPVVGEVEVEKRAPQATVLALRDERWMELLERERIRVSAYRLGIRVSVGFYNNEADISRLLEVLEQGKAAGIPLC